MQNHTRCLQNPEDANGLDPRSPANADVRAQVDTEACEQAFSFLDRVTYVLQEMGPGLFHVYMYLILDMENARVVAGRGH